MAEYFSHDYDAREDEKIQNLIFKYGMEGYGIFWSIVELLYKNDGYMQSDYPRIAFALHSYRDIIESVINDFDLFKMHDDSFTSTSVLHRIKLRKGKSTTARKAAKIRWGKEKANNANALQTQSDSNAIKKRKVKKSKVNIIKDREEAFFKQVENFCNYPSYLLKEFFEYWSEQNPTGKKMRFELEKTWDLERRLSRWSANSKLKAPQAQKKKNSPEVERILNEDYKRYNKGKSIGDILNERKT